MYNSILFNHYKLNEYQILLIMRINVKQHFY